MKTIERQIIEKQDERISLLITMNKSDIITDEMRELDYKLWRTIKRLNVKSQLKDAGQIRSADKLAIKRAYDYLTDHFEESFLVNETKQEAIEILSLILLEFYSLESQFQEQPINQTVAYNIGLQSYDQPITVTDEMINKEAKKYSRRILVDDSNEGRKSRTYAEMDFIAGFKRVLSLKAQKPNIKE